MAIHNLLRIFTSLLFSGDPVIPATPVVSLPQFSKYEATVVKAIEPLRTGQIRFQGSWWSARCQRNIVLRPGELVNVVGRQNITLLVEPIASGRTPFSSNTHSPLLAKETATEKEVQLI